MKRSRQGKKSQTKSQTKSRTKSVNSHRSGQASRTHSTWGFARISERHAGPRAGTSITRAAANVGRPTPTFATGVAPAATGCPCRTTGPCGSGRETSAASARRRASRSASIIVTPPARCGACCAATAISASATTRTIPFLPGPRRPIWKRRGATTGISRAPPARARFDFTISCSAGAGAECGRKPGSRNTAAVFVDLELQIHRLGGDGGKSQGNLQENSGPATCPLQACRPNCS